MPTNCTVCGGRLDLHKSGLSHHMQSHQQQHPSTCGLCGKTFNHADNLTKHLKYCTGHRQSPPLPPQQQQKAATTPLPRFTIHHQYSSMGGAVESYNINMQETQHLVHLSTAPQCPPTYMTEFHTKHRAYKLQVPITIVCHKAVDPSVVPQPPVTLTLESHECFKWVIQAGMHYVDVHVDRRGKYVEHMGKYDFSSLHFPVPFHAVGYFTLRNNMYINVYGVDDDNEVIYPSHPHSYQIDMWIYYSSNAIVYITTPPLGTLADWLGDS